MKTLKSLLCGLGVLALLATSSVFADDVTGSEGANPSTATGDMNAKPTKPAHRKHKGMGKAMHKKHKDQAAPAAPTDAATPTDGGTESPK